MADTNTRVIIDVTLNSADATAKATDLGTEIAVVREEQKKLRAEGKQNDVAFQQNALNLRALTAEQKAYITISQSADGSNNQLRAQLSLLTQQYNALSKEERDNSVAGKALQVQIKGLSDEIKTNEEKVGDHRRSVGDYAKANRDATDTVKEQTTELKTLGGVVDRAPVGFKLLGDQLNNVKNQLTNFKEASQQAKIAQKEYQEAQQIATAATEASAAATEAATAIGFKFAAGEATAAEAEAALALATDSATVATAAQTAATEAQTVATAAGTNAAKVFKIALASTGIGAVIILVAALINYLSKFDPVMDKLEQGFAAVSAVVDTLGRLFVGFISGLTDVQGTIEKVVNFLVHPIDSFKALGSAIGEAASAAVDLKKAQQDLEDQQKIQEVTNARAIQQIQQLTLQSKNRTLSEKERQGLLKQASKLDQDNFDQRTKLVNEQRRQAQEQIAITAGLNAKERKMLDEQGLEYAFQLKDRAAVTDEQVDALKAAELERISILSESTNRQEKIQNQSDALAEKAAAAEEKRLAKIAQATEKAKEADQARLDSLLKTNESMLTEFGNQRDAIDNDINQKIEKYKKYGGTTEQLEKERAERLRQLTNEFNKKNLAEIDANNKAIQDIAVNSIKDEGTKKLAQLQLNQSRELDDVTAQQTLIQERIAKGETGLSDLFKSYDDRKTAILAEGTIARNQIITDNYALELEAFNQQQILLAEANAATGGTDAEKLIASQSLLDAQYQQQIDAANLAGQDTTLIVAQYEAQKKAIQQQTTDAAYAGFKGFSTSFQGLVKENTIAYKLAGAIQAKVDAAQALRNNILIIQENIKALSAQGKLPFPFNIVAIFSTLAALGSAVLSAKTLVSPVALATGGVFDSGGRGAVLPGYSRTDDTNAFLRSGEAVIVSEATRDPKGLAALNAINVAYGGDPLAPGFTMATGGIAQGGFVSSISNDANNMFDVASVVIAAVAATPAPIVDVRDITTSQIRTENSVVRANL